MAAKLVGHSAYCVRDLWAKVVAEDDVEVVYLTDIKMEQLFKSFNHQLRIRAGLLPEGFEELEKHDQHMHIALRESRKNLDEGGSPIFKEVDAALADRVITTCTWIATGLIKLRPPEMGEVGKAYWTRGGTKAEAGKKLEPSVEDYFLI